jgi:hypothetical protein
MQNNEISKCLRMWILSLEAELKFAWNIYQDHQKNQYPYDYCLDVYTTGLIIVSNLTCIYSELNIPYDQYDVKSFHKRSFTD